MTTYGRLYLNRGRADRKAGLPPAAPEPRRKLARKWYLVGYGR